MKRNQSSYLFMAAFIMVSSVIMREAIRIRLQDDNSPATVSQSYQPGKASESVNQGQHKNPSQSLKLNQSVITSTDKKIQIKVPGSWQRVNYAMPSDKFQISAKSNSRNLEIAVAAQPKVSGMSLNQYAQRVKDRATAQLQEAQAKRTQVSQINGQRAVQYQIHGTHQNPNSKKVSKAVVLLTVTETPKSRYLIVSTSPSDLFEKKQEELQSIIQSFQESSTVAAKK